MNQQNQIAVPMLNLADTRRAVENAPDLSDTRRRDLLSDIATVSRWLDLPPSSISVDATKLRPILDGLHHAQIGVSKKRLRNAISNLNAAIKIATVSQSPKRHAPFRTPEWEARLTSFQREWDSYRVAGLATYCSEHHIEDTQIDDSVLDSYRDHLNRKSLRKDPDKACALTIQSWNKLIDQGTAPHLQRLTVTRSGKHWATPLTEFPEAFRADLDRWLDRLTNVDLLSDDGPAKPLRPHSIENVRVAVRHSASALFESGVSKESIKSLSDLTNLQNFKTILRFFINRNDGDVPTWLHGLAGKLLAIARHHIQFSLTEIEPLVTLTNRVKVVQDGMTTKNKVRLGQFDDPQNIAMLVQLSANTLKRVESRTVPSRWDALDVMYSVAVDILLAVPMRRSNLVALNIEQHITWRGHGAGRYAALMIPEHEVKNGVAIESDLPKETSRLLRTYLETYRPRISGDPEGWLFPMASGGGHRTPASLANQMFQFIRRETGLEVNAHLFRHLSGFLYLMRFPGQYEVVRRMLGHKSVETTIRFYTSLESKWALKRYDETILVGWRKPDDTP